MLAAWAIKVRRCFFDERHAPAEDGVEELATGKAVEAFGAVFG
jgi:hypothetical protein